MRITGISLLFAVLTLSARAQINLGPQQPIQVQGVTQTANGGTGSSKAFGYTPVAGSGLTLMLGAALTNCGGTIATYAGGMLSMTASATNYVYLNTAASCVPAVKTSTFTASDIPVAVVVAGSSAITSVTDVRTAFTLPGAASASLSGQTPTCAPKAATSTTSTSSLPICDDGTNITITHPVIINSTTTPSQETFTYNTGIVPSCASGSGVGCFAVDASGNPEGAVGGGAFADFCTTAGCGSGLFSIAHLGGGVSPTGQTYNLGTSSVLAPGDGTIQATSVNSTTAGQVAGNFEQTTANNYPLLSQQYWAAHVTNCQQSLLTGDVSSPFATSVCLTMPQDNSFAPMWNYGSPGTLSDIGGGGHGSLSVYPANYFNDGINQGFGLYANSNHGGDDQLENHQLWLKPACIFGSDECSALRREVFTEQGEYDAPVTPSVNSPGATTIQMGTGGPSNAVNTAIGLHGPLIDLTTRQTDTLTYVSGGSSAVALAMLSTLSVTSSITGTLAGDVDAPRIIGNTTGQLSKASVTVTLNVTGGSPITTSSICSIMGPALFETVKPTAVGSLGGGTQSVTAVFHYSHTSGTPFYCGGAAGEYVELTGASAASGLRYVENVYGSVSPHTLIIGHQVPNGVASVLRTYFNGTASLYQGAEVVGVVDSADGVPDGGQLTVEANAMPLATVPITAWSITSNVATFTATNTYTAGQLVWLASFGTSTFFNGQPVTVLSSGLSGTQFEANFTHANGSATEAGKSLDVLENDNNISAGYNEHFYGAGGFGIYNPFATRTEELTGWVGLGGASGQQANGWKEFQNENSPSLYAGAGGIWNAPWLIFGTGTVGNGIALQYLPIYQGGSPANPGLIGNCAGSFLCATSGPVPGATSQLTNIFEEGDKGDRFTYDYANDRFNLFSQSGAASLMNGNAILTTASGVTTGSGTSPDFACWTGTSSLGNCPFNNGGTQSGVVTSTVPVNIPQLIGGVGSSGIIQIAPVSLGDTSGDNAVQCRFYGYNFSGGAASGAGQIYCHGELPGTTLLMDTTASSHGGGIGIGYALGANVPAGLSMASGTPFTLAGLTGCLTANGTSPVTASGSCGGGGSSVGTAGQVQKVGSTAGSFAASALTDNASTVTSTEPVVVNAGTVSTPSLILNNTYTGTGGLPVMQQFVPGATSPAIVLTDVGVAPSTNNTTRIGFNYAGGADSATNFSFIGLWPQTNVLAICSNGAIATDTNAGATSCPSVNAGDVRIPSGATYNWNGDSFIFRNGSSGSFGMGTTSSSTNGILALATLNASTSVTASVIAGTGSGNTVETTSSGTATSGANFNSGSLAAQGSYWNGASAASDTWSATDSLGTGTNPTSTLTWAHSGSSGITSVVIPTVTLSAPIGTPTCAANTGGGVTSCAARTSYPAPTNTRGDLTIVGGTATTGLIATVSFSGTLSAAPSCSVVQEGGTALFGIDVGAPSTSSFTITAGVSVIGATLNVHYNCVP